MRVLKPTTFVHSRDPARYRRTTSVRWSGGSYEISGDNPATHGGDGTGPDGFELLTAALGQCLLNTLIANAEGAGIPIRTARASVAARACRTGDAAPYLSEFQVEVHVDGDLDNEQREWLERTTVQLCGVRETLMRTPTITEHLHVDAPSS